MNKTEILTILGLIAIVIISMTITTEYDIEKSMYGSYSLYINSFDHNTNFSNLTILP